MRTERLFLWHTLPLHYLPYLLATGELLSAARLQEEGYPVRPRPSAIARKTKLGLADYVHLSLASATPLLADKQRKGYPHVLLAWERDRVLALPNVALLRYNTKRWAHRDDFLPVTNAEEQAALLAAHARGRYPSLEVLVPRVLRLTPELVVDMHFAGDTEQAAILPVLGLIPGRFVPPHRVSPEHFGGCVSEPDLALVRDYVAECVAAGRVLAPPALPFD